MKYKDYIKQLQQLPHRSSSSNGTRTIAEMYADNVDIWSNYACIGYARIAMNAAGLDIQSIDKVIKELHKAFDDYTIEQAEEHY